MPGAGTTVPGPVMPAGGAAVPTAGATVAGAVMPGAVVPVPGAAVPMAVAAGAVMPAVGAAVPGTVISAAGAVVPAAQEEIGSDNVVSSPLVGIFYSASSPDAEDFVKVGDRVKKGQVLGIIEAMKLMNEIESEYDGVVEAILVRNEDVVEYGQPLFRIR
ncbi:MAG: acetyl-CoA carboxylase biotin carboxyl carrier protein [Hungatella sp.]|nr:acetyl-CoA carboxylase biotin carboxyl carrier protein [Hungatella sp.]